MKPFSQFSAQRSQLNVIKAAEACRAPNAARKYSHILQEVNFYKRPLSLLFPNRGTEATVSLCVLMLPTTLRDIDKFLFEF